MFFDVWMLIISESLCLVYFGIIFSSIVLTCGLDALQCSLFFFMFVF